MRLHASSPPFTASSKMRKTLRPFVQKVLRPPPGTLRGPTCSSYCVLQYKIGLGLNNPRFLMLFAGGPRGPREAPERRPRGLFAAMAPGGPQEASKRPSRGSQEALKRPQEPVQRPQEAPKRPLRATQEAPKRPSRGPQDAL